MRLLTFLSALLLALPLFGLRPLAADPPQALAAVYRGTAPAGETGVQRPVARMAVLQSETPQAAPTAMLRPIARAVPSAKPAAPQEPAPYCNPDNTVCIRVSARTEDTCDALERLAIANNLPPGFFARLIWRESLFDFNAISPAGALGIAQFMPGTARLRGLEDPFNPAAALAASAAYLADLRDRFGNLGLAAVAYNAGEDRAARFRARQAGLPGETRAYVAIITGFPATDWRDRPPGEIDLSLAPGKPFRDACIAQAQTRTLRQYKAPPTFEPWAVIIAAHQNRDVAAARYRAAARRNAVLQRYTPQIARQQLGPMRSPQYIAQIGQPTRTAALRLCQEVQRNGAVCAVLRN